MRAWQKAEVENAIGQRLMVEYLEEAVEKASEWMRARLANSDTGGDP